jgi:hypothetical protein
MKTQIKIKVGRNFGRFRRQLGDFFTKHLVTPLGSKRKETKSADPIVARVARFFWEQHTNTGKIYQMTTKYTIDLQHTKRLHNIPNRPKLYQHFLSIPRPSKIYPSGDSGFRNIPSIWQPRSQP